MNLEEAKTALDKKEVKPIYYSLNGIRGDWEDGTSILEKNGDKWMYYYYERRGKSSIKFFNTENEACKYMYKTLISDPITRIYNPPQ
jgi:hypothetical protein